MRKEAILIDLDNTIIDTAIRKQLLLKDFLPSQNISIQQIRDDYDLVTIFGNVDTSSNKSFREKLDSDEGISKYKAPLRPNVQLFLDKYTNKGLAIIVITARPESLRNVTIDELKNLKIDMFITELHMRESSTVSENDFKVKKIDALLDKYDCVAAIGDRLEDLNAATFCEIPFFLIRTTHTSNELLSLHELETYGGGICSSWDEIDSDVETILEGRKKLRDLRDIFTESYAKWLADIDNKCRITATISGVLSALVGKYILDNKNTMQDMDYILLFVLVLSILSLLYSIRSMTSRYTSGKSAANPIIANTKQWISILVGMPKQWQYKPQDPIDIFNTVKKGTNRNKSRAHYAFFLNKYNTYDPESLSNLHLLELRAVNYSKAYAENISSRLLFYAIVMLILWLVYPYMCLIAIMLWFIWHVSPYMFSKLKKCYEWGRSIIH